MNAIVSALRLSALRTRWRSAAAMALAAVAVTFIAYKVAVGFAFRDENRPAGEEIVAAMEAYKVANKRYPERLAELQPKYIGKIPAPASGTNFVYAIPSDGKAAWFGYQTLRGVFIEYDSQSRAWREMDYDDSQALRMLTKEFVMGPK
jgi:hypothetical protein